MNYTRVVSVAILPFGLVNAFLIINSSGVILVDAGLPNTEKKIKKALDAEGLTFSDIKLIIITHAHVDHAGNAACIKQLSGAPILAHKNDLPYYHGEKPMTFCATGWFGRVFFKTGLIQQAYTRFTPDILLNNKDEIDLFSYGFSGRVVSTPGHTPGSISVILDKGEGLEQENAIVGDLISSGILLGGICCKNTPKQPPFEEDSHQVSESLNQLVNTGSQKFYMGHGGPLDASIVKKHIVNLQKLARDKLSPIK